MKTFSWQAQLASGAAGQEAVKAWLLGAGYAVTDVSADPRYQGRDIDFLVSGLSVEVKTEHAARTNLFIEFDALQKSTADLWVYYLPHKLGGWALVFDKLDLDCWVDTYADAFEVKTVRTQAGRRSWTVTGIAVPITRLLSALPVLSQTGVARWPTGSNSLALPLRPAS